MRRTAKIVSVVLAALMILTLVPFAAFAADNDTADRVDGWKANYQLFLDTILDNSNYTSWNYVDQNSKALNNSYNAMTAFALYDSAWRNYLTKEVSVDNWKYKLYVHLWCDFFPVRALITHVVSKIKKIRKSKMRRSEG